MSYPGYLKPDEQERVWAEQRDRLIAERDKALADLDKTREALEKAEEDRDREMRRADKAIMELARERLALAADQGSEMTTFVRTRVTKNPCARCGHPQDWHRLDDATNQDPTDPWTTFRCIGYDCTKPGPWPKDACDCPDFLAADQGSAET